MRAFVPEDFALINLANDIVSMSDAYRLLGLPDADYASSGAKVACPFGSVFHPDGQKSFRIYDDRGGFCFACNERYTPVSLVAKAKDCSIAEAAEALLEAVNHKQRSAEERFAEAYAPSVAVDTDSLAEALKLYCARMFPLWGIDQFDDRVSARLRKVLDLLPSVNSEEDSRLWLEGAKTAMTNIMNQVSGKENRA